MRTKTKKAAERIRELAGRDWELAIVLGSGFQRVIAAVRPGFEVSYAEIPGFPSVKVKGHPGRLLGGRLGGIEVLILAGRAHFYEGHTLEEVTFPVRALGELGVRTVLLTNAAGGINPKFQPGDFMIIKDHINGMGINPLRERPGGWDRFVDMTEAYDSGLQNLLVKAGRRVRARVHRGVYVAVPGPSYETPAEIRALRRLGADGVGMSTVPETIVARQCGMAVAGLSLITNRAAGLGGGPLTHQDVLARGEAAGEQAAELLQAFAEMYGKKRTENSIVNPSDSG